MLGREAVVDRHHNVPRLVRQEPTGRVVRIDPTEDEAAAVDPYEDRERAVAPGDVHPDGQVVPVRPGKQEVTCGRYLLDQLLAPVELLAKSSRPFY